MILVVPFVQGSLTKQPSHTLNTFNVYQAGQKKSPNGGDL